MVRTYIPFWVQMEFFFRKNYQGWINFYVDSKHRLCCYTITFLQHTLAWQQAYDLSIHCPLFLRKSSVQTSAKTCWETHLYVTKKITCQKSPIFRAFLRMWTLKFYSQNRGSPKAFFECFWDLNWRFLIFKRIESRFGEKIPKPALFYCEKLSQSFRRFLVRYAELIEK